MNKNKFAQYRKKNIVLVSDTFFPMVDGVTRFIAEVTPRLMEDYNVTVIAPRYGKKNETKAGLNVIYCPVIKMFNIAGYPMPWPKIRKMWRAIRDSKLVFIQSGPMLGGASILIARWMKKPVVMFMHQIAWEQLPAITRGPKFVKNFVRWFSSRYTRFISNRCDTIMVSSENVIKKLERNGIYKDKKIVPLGINVQKFKATEDKQESKKKIGIHPKKFVIGYCGRISYEKDIDTLLKAFKILKKRYKNLFLLVVGDGSCAIKDGIKLTRNTKVTGFVKDVVPYYQAMDAYVTPSLTETTGLTILEALACQLPVITTPVGFATTNIEKNENGILFPKRSVEVLVTRLEELINNQTLRVYLGRGGRLTVEKGFTWEKTVGRIKKEFEEMFA